MLTAGQVYRPTGAFDPAGTIFALFTGLVAAAAVGAALAAWESSGLPTLVLVTSLLHGLAIGALLAWLFRMARMRNPAVAAALAIVCAVVSIGVAHYGHYWHFQHHF